MQVCLKEDVSAHSVVPLQEIPPKLFGPRNFHNDHVP